jgi:TRAP-type C4-dicarboxylate transport system substrate-binding protein
MKTQNVFITGCIAAACLFGATQSFAKKPKVTVRVVTPFATGHILADTAFEFERLVEKASKGNIDAVVTTAVMNEQTINAAMTPCDPAQRVGDIMLTGGQPIQDWAPQYFFFNGPYVITDYDHFLNVWDSHLGDEARVLINNSGNLVDLGTVYRGFRQFTSNSPINGPADLQGLLLRLPGVPDWRTVWESLGAVSVTVPLPGIYQALLDGTAEASEGDLTQISSLLLYEVQDYLSLTNHLVGFGMVLANECFMTELKNKDEKDIEKSMRKATEFGTQKIIDGEAALLASLQANGMTVVNPDAAAIRAAAQPAIDGLFATKWTVTTWDEVLSFENVCE